MIALSCENLSLSFGTDIILDRISFSINDGDRLGIVGVNGAGKSTLFKLISGEYAPDSGNVFVSKDKSLGILDQYVNLNADNTLLDEMLNSFGGLLNTEKQLNELNDKIEAGETSLADTYALLHDRFTAEGGYEFRGRCKGILKNLGFDERFWDMRISGLSGGQKTRIALARLLLSEPDMLLLDEPTNHLDTEALFWLEDFLKSYRKTVIVISHDRYFLDSVTNKILEIENHRAKLYSGNYTSFVNQKNSDREIQERHWKNQQREITRIEAYIEQQKRWNRERNIIAAESRQKLLDKMEKVERPDALPDSIRLRFNKCIESGNEVLTLKKLSKGYANKPLFQNFDLLIKKREHIFITGHNGCGKSTLIKIIAGKLTPDSGKIEYGYNVITGYYDQENQELCDTNTVIDEIWNEYDKYSQTEIRNALALFLFRGDDIEKPVGILSGGEKARLTLAKLILSKMNLLILDEPTNHLDINSREALEKALLEFDGTIIAVSHDRYFIKKLATRILDFDAVGNYNIYDFRGNYEEYLEYKKNNINRQQTKDETSASDSREQYMAAKKALSEKRRHENQVKRTAAEITRFETEIENINAEINGDAAADHIRLGELYSKKDELETKLLELYELYETYENESSCDTG